MSLRAEDRALQAVGEVAWSLERVEGHRLPVAAGVPALGRVAVRLQQYVVDVYTPHMQDSLEALVQEHVLAPKAIPGAELPEVGHALVHPFVPDGHSVAGQNLERPVHPQLAIVDVHGLLLGPPRQRDQSPSKAVGEEHRVGIDLDRPVPPGIDLVVNNLSPDVHEDVIVQGRLEFAAIVAFQALPGDDRRDARRHLRLLAAVYRGVLTAKNTGIHCMRIAKQVSLVTPGHHDCKAEEADGKA
mmetsp:Transcript_11684/g.35252  ORF Transcript_11684/g.35252 Transcript_11684/m.35252 type:complete len:243 (+) Transcript_11684:125-853(+)